MKRNKDEKFRKKVFTVTQSRSGNSIDESELKHERANLCFMASKLEEEVSNSNSHSFNELQETFDYLTDEYKCMCIKNKLL